MFKWVNLCWEGTRDETRDGPVTLDMSANSCSSFSARLQVFLRKTQHFGCQVFLKRGRTESTENCCSLEVAVMPEHLETCPCICPSVQGDLLEWDNCSCFPKELGVLAGSHPCPSALCTDSALCLSLQTRTATVKSLNWRETLDSQLCPDCRTF